MSSNVDVSGGGDSKDKKKPVVAVIDIEEDEYVRKKERLSGGPPRGMSLVKQPLLGSANKVSTAIHINTIADDEDDDEDIDDNGYAQRQGQSNGDELNHVVQVLKSDVADASDDAHSGRRNVDDNDKSSGAGKHIAATDKSSKPTITAVEGWDEGDDDFWND